MTHVADLGCLVNTKYFLSVTKNILYKNCGRAMSTKKFFLNLLIMQFYGIDDYTYIPNLYFTIIFSQSMIGCV